MLTTLAYEDEGDLVRVDALLDDRRADLHELGVKNVVIPRKAKPGLARREFEHRRAFRKLVKRRTGSEGRISNLKRNYGWNRTLITGLEGARSTVDTGSSPTHNLIKIGALAA